MTYTVHEIFLTAQGEGANLGRTAVFIRFAGCNLWSGREEDRATAVCRFCDTEFRGGERHDAASLVAAALALWPAGAGHRFTVLTGGEPLLQVDAPLLEALHAAGFTVAIETNGTLPLPGADRLGLRQPQGRGAAGAGGGRRAEAGLSPGRASDPAGAGRLPRRAALALADGWAGDRGEYRRGRRLLPGASGMAAEHPGA